MATKVDTPGRQKQCSECREIKPVAQFYKLRRGYSGYCRDCSRQYSKRYRGVHVRRLDKLGAFRRETLKGRLRMVAQGFARRATQAGVASALSAEDLFDLLKDARGRCAYCGSQLTLDAGARELEFDHKVPLSAGGDNTLDNVAPVCHQCNASKGTTPLEEWEGVRDATSTRG